MAKKNITLLLTGILMISLFSIVLVQADDEIATIEDIERAGIKPDSILYGIDIGLERMTEMFSEKAKLRHTKERLSEIRLMINESKFEDAEKGIKNFNRLRNRIKNQTMVQEHSELIDNLGQKISGIASQQGKLTEAQREEIKLLILEHKGRIKIEEEELENEINKKGKAGDSED